MHQKELRDPGQKDLQFHQVCLICYRPSSAVKFLSTFLSAWLLALVLHQQQESYCSCSKDRCYFKELLYKPNHQEALCLACLLFGGPNKMTPFSDTFICSTGRLSAHPFFLPVESICVCIKVPTYYEIVIKQNFALNNVTVETNAFPPPSFFIVLLKFTVTCFFQLCPL